VTILERLTLPRAATVESPAVPLTSSTLLELFGGGKATSGVSVTEKNSLTMPAVWRAVNLIAETAASLPLHAYRRGDKTRTPLGSGQAADLLASPHPDLTPMELWSIVYAHGLLWGNAYLRILRDGLGRVRELWPVEPWRVKAGRESETGTKVYEIDGGAPAGGMDLTDKEILHLPAFGYDGICGVSPIRMAREGIGLGLAAEQYAAQLFGNGSLASGVLQTEQRLTKDQADRLHSRWKQKSSGISNAHEAVVLDSGVKFHQLTIPPEDAQFLESRKFQVEEIARMFGIPPHMLGSVEGSTSWGTGLEQQVTGFVVFTMRPWLTRGEQRITRLLKPEPVYARYSLEGLLRGDSAQRADFYTKMFALGWSVNEIRELEDKGPVEGGDRRFISLNLGALDTPEVADPETAPAPDGEGGTDAPTSADVALNVVTALQKGYLGVDVVVTVEEMRELLNQAGANLKPGNPFPPDEPVAPPAETEETEPVVPAETEGVPADA
jgi:HK97 family phage portal protein